jgi:hypothetical protein
MRFKALWTYLLLQWVDSYVCKGIVSDAFKDLISYACESPISFFTYKAYPFTHSLPFITPFLGEMIDLLLVLVIES